MQVNDILTHWKEFHFWGLLCSTCRLGSYYLGHGCVCVVSIYGWRKSLEKNLYWLQVMGRPFTSLGEEWEKRLNGKGIPVLECVTLWQLSLWNKKSILGILVHHACIHSSIPSIHLSVFLFIPSFSCDKLLVALLLLIPRMSCHLRLVMFCSLTFLQISGTCFLFILTFRNIYV